jgi:REP-associated tyrosine transposase
MKNAIFKRAPHNPPHLFLPNTLYMLTASTYQYEPLMQSSKRKMEWLAAFLKAADIYQWQVIAWVILQNHYHAIVQAPNDADTLSKFVGSYHKFTARKWNEEENLPGRKVWWNYWDTCLRSENDYYTRLRYIYWNPVKHALSSTPKEYEFSNYKEFRQNWQADFNFTDKDEVTDVPEC